MSYYYPERALDPPEPGPIPECDSVECSECGEPGDVYADIWHAVNGDRYCDDCWKEIQEGAA